MTRRLFTPAGGAVAFAALVLLVVGVLSWVTVAALRVEESQRRAAVRADAANAERLALWQLDGRLFPVFGAENARPFAHYYPMHSPVAAGPPVRLPSPLLSADLPDWMPLHVQLDPTTGWSSPQVPPTLLVAEFVAQAADVPNATAARRELLAAFARDLPPVEALAQLTAADDPSEGGLIVPVVVGDPTKPQTPEAAAPPAFGVNVRGTAVNPGGGEGGPPPPGPGGMPPANPQAGGGRGGYLDNSVNLSGDMKRRVEARDKTQQEVRGANDAGGQLAVVPPASPPPGYEFARKKESPSPVTPPPAPAPAAAPAAKPDSPQPMAKRTADPPARMMERQAGEQLKDAAKPPAAETEFFALGRKPSSLPLPPAVHLGNLRPVWLTSPSGAEYLMLVRPARMESKTLYQGVLLDWPVLRELLRAEVSETLPGADVVPLRDPSTATDRAMTALPVALAPGADPEPPPCGWTPLRLGLASAWVAAVVALLAVGFGGRALIDLSERRIRFVSAVTHELRTPLTSLRLYLDLLTSGMVSDEEKRREYLGTLSTESERLNRLIENVLDFARLENRGANAHRQPTPAAVLLDEAARTWTDRLAADGRELVIVSTLPAGQQVCTDPRMAGQIIGNLIDNARKYAKPATDPRVWLWAKPGGRRRVVFEVEDRGPGVPPAGRRHIFRPFRRGPDADTTAGGAGLGLALAKQWAEAVGGRLTCRDADGGVGACFRLELPVG